MPSATARQGEADVLRSALSVHMNSCSATIGPHVFFFIGPSLLTSGPKPLRWRDAAIRRAAA